MFNKLKERLLDDHKKMFYRLRDNSTQGIVSSAFSYVDNFDEIKEIIMNFLEENKKFSIITSNAIAHEVYGRPGVILQGDNMVLELDDRLYKLFKNDIEKKLNTYETNAIDLFGITNSTKINIGNFVSKIDIKQEICDPGSAVDVGIVISAINFNRTNSYDMELLNCIIDNFLKEKQTFAEIKHIKDRNFYLICDSEKMLFDFYAYDIVSEKLRNHNNNLTKTSNGIAYQKKNK